MIGLSHAASRFRRRKHCALSQAVVAKTVALIWTDLQFENV